MPSTLLILDLSYTGSLASYFESSVGVFVECPQLIKLVLDGCELSSTIVNGVETKRDTEVGIVDTSLFLGLVCLKELSLRENVIESVESLRGLEWFVDHCVEPSTVLETSTAAAVSAPLPTLCYVNLADNPVTDITACRQSAIHYITQTVPSVIAIDGKSVPPRSKSEELGMNKVCLAYLSSMSEMSRGVRRADELVTETMTKEFDLSLKGERDVSVIS